MDEGFPALPFAEWRDTCATLHMWTQVVGKVRLALSPKVNHWWNVALYVNARGLTTSAVPYRGGVFDIQFDFIDHRLEIRASDGGVRSFPLVPQTVAMFYRETMEALRSLGIEVEINTKPQEVADPVPFERDERHASYDAEYAARWWRILVSTACVLEEFRAGFTGKCSPVHFFWGSFDLCCTRFSGRPAPPRKGLISGEAYSHEVISAGFWPGGGGADAAYYAYTVPAPPGFESAQVRPGEAYWSKDLKEFLLNYEDVRRAESPRAALMDFLKTTYDAGANLAGWDPNLVTGLSARGSR
jgi:hypothetical protein